QTFETEVENYVKGDYIPRISPFFVPKLIINLAPGMISMKFGLRGVNYASVSPCASSNTAIMDAFNYIRWGKGKVFVTGGSEAGITPISIGGFSAMKGMSGRNDDPQTASRPFDENRDGSVMGEGAGATILEEYEHAKARGAKNDGEIGGAAITADAYHMTSPHPQGLRASKSMGLALEAAGLRVEDVDYLNPHATAAPVGDISELKAVNQVFKGAKTHWLSSTKSMTG